MPIPPEINAIVQRLNQELNDTEQEANQARTLTQRMFSTFPDNQYLIQVFASISNNLFFVQVQRTRVQGILSRLQPDGISREIIQEAGEELGAILGQVVDVKINAASLRRQLEDLL